MRAKPARPAKDQLSLELEAAFVALFRRETASVGTTAIRFHPVVGPTLAVGYAF